MNKTIKTIKERLVFQNNFLKFYNNLVEFPDGSTHDFVAIEMNNFVNILPIIDDKILMVNQYRYPWNQNTWELPAGIIEPGEEPSKAAHRELEEETGHKIIELQHILTYRPIGLMNNFGYLFQAKVEKTGHQKLDETELLTVGTFNFQEVKKMLDENRIIQAASLINLFNFFQKNP